METPLGAQGLQVKERIYTRLGIGDGEDEKAIKAAILGMGRERGEDLLRGGKGHSQGNKGCSAWKEELSSARLQPFQSGSGE